MLGVRVLDEADGEHDKKKRKKEAKDRKKDKRRSNKESSKRHEHRVDAGGEGHGGEREPQAGQEMWDRMFGDNRGNDGESAADASADPNPEPEPPAAKANHVDPTTTRTTNNTVGDGGASWRMKALKRAQTQADERGTSLRDVVSQRWGSVSELAEGADKAAPMDAHRQFNRGMKSKMRRPGGGDGGDWRKRAEGRQEGRDGRGGRGESGKRQKQEYEYKYEYEGVVARAARDMNQFKGDGSFMEQFEKEQGGREKRSEHTVSEGRPVSRPPAGQATDVPGPPSRPPQVAHSARHTEPQDNNSVAAMLRARLGGKAAPAPAASQPVQPARPTRRAEPTPAETSEVHLPMVDAHGRAAPGAFGRETAAQAHTKPADEADLDLQTMVRRVKHGTEEDMNDIIARNIATNTYYRDTAADDEYDFDVGQDILTAQKVSKRGKKDPRGPNAELERKEKARQINEYRRMTKAQNQCRLCLDKNNANSHLTVSMSASAYLALPDRGRLVPGHCVVVPTDHIASARLADETTWEEMRNFKKCVLQMMQGKGMECIFFETVLDVTSTIPKRHARIDCVPVSPQVMDRAPMYFKKAIEDATSDWSQHASKGCIETESRHLQRKIPPNFPYVHIEFGLASGFVSVIDDVQDFDRDFCRRVILGLLESSGNASERNASAIQAKGSRDGVEVQKVWAREFTAAFKEFDWVG